MTPVTDKSKWSPQRHEHEPGCRLDGATSALLASR
jgi:hypothetical protein